MTMRYSLVSHRQFLGVFLALISLAGLSRLGAQPTIVSVVPADGATGVATSSQVVFTFSTGMSTYTQAFFTNDTGSFFPVTSAWSAGNTVLTCTPSPTFPANTVVYWSVAGFDSGFNPLSGPATGSFSTGGGGGGGTGHGTNRITSFVVSKIYVYDQSSSATPSPDTNAPYIFGATTLLASNRTATSITVTLPTTGVSNLTQNITAPEDWYLVGFDNDQALFENRYPQGGYTFNVQAAASNQTLVVSMPLDMPQPNAPHVTNYTAAQAIDPTSAFTLGWDAFTGGAGTSNAVYLSITGSGTNVFETGDPRVGNALPGTTLSATIPANTLQPGATYDASLGFYHALTVTNNSVNLSSAFRASETEFSITTSSGAGGPLSFGNPQISNGTVSFNISCSVGQTFTILSASDPTLPMQQWSVLLTTNSTSTEVHFVDPRPATARAMFYRARNGN